MIGRLGQRKAFLAGGPVLLCAKRLKLLKLE